MHKDIGIFGTCSVRNVVGRGWRVHVFNRSARARRGTTGPNDNTAPLFSMTSSHALPGRASPAGGTAPQRLLRVAAVCPRCAKPPRLRIPEGERELSLGQQPDALKTTYQCHHCGHVYPLDAGAYQRAA